ncbi:acyltransferase [Bradyrhizobium sp. CB2312]|uniref:acyltransferase family protein n=1 Tax=Bradyrhizobium sp. CB2312 TaxID=3039155 RepID=UPI0024B093FC|nr:acyltransferase [Bradyrhizobium sp. CB2312]WFU70965.1 acyltransferase [Bradyrhizobium sp. CB2312]
MPQTAPSSLDASHKLPAKQILGVDLLRFSASLTVMCFHLCFFVWAGGPGATARTAAKSSVQFQELRFFEFGSVGVQIFFVISGFIIAYSAHGSTAYDFLRGRFVRLVPAVWLIAPLSFAALLAVNAEPVSVLLVKLVKSLLISPFGPWLDWVYWTLPIEIAFYALVYLLLLLKRFRWLEGSIIFVGGVSTVFWLARRSWSFLTGEPLLPLPHERVMELLLICHGCFFAVGVVIWLLIFDRSTTWRWISLSFVTIGCVAQNGAFTGAYIWLASVALLYMSAKFNYVFRDQKKALAVARTLGLTTYPLYLLHNAVGGALMGYLVRMGLDRYPALGLTLVAMVLAAAFIAVAIEPIAQRAFRSIFDLFGGLVFVRVWGRKGFSQT